MFFRGAAGVNNCSLTQLLCFFTIGNFLVPLISPQKFTKLLYFLNPRADVDNINTLSNANAAIYYRKNGS